MNNQLKKEAMEILREYRSMQKRQGIVSLIFLGNVILVLIFGKVWL